MKILNCVLILILTSVSCSQKGDVSVVKPPVAKQIKKELTAHGDTRIDNYYWLNERENPEVIKYLEDENAYTKAIMKDTEQLQETLFKEITGRIKQNDESVPYKYNGYFYYSRYEKGKEYPIYCRKKDSLDSEEIILIDVNEMAVGHNFYSLRSLNVSPDNKLLAYAVDDVGRRKYRIHFKNLDTGELLKDTIVNTTGGTVWGNDNKTVFYTIKDHTLRSYKILKHVLGNDSKNDVLVFHEEDDTFSTFVFKTKSEKYIIIGSSSTLSDEYRFIDADKPDSEFSIIQKRERGLEYSVDHYKADFYITTNLDAKNFRLMKSPVNKTEKENWIEVIPHRENVLLNGIEIFDRFLVLSERKDGLMQIRVTSWDKNADYYVVFNDAAYVVYLTSNFDFDTDIIRFSYSSPVTPASVYDFNMISKERTLLKQDEIIGDFNPENYITERLMAEARDGVKVPVSLVYRKDMKKESGNPLLLYGYGSYGYSTDARFNSAAISLLDRGFVYAIAHIRGGQEIGRSWYEDGKLLKKKNTFTDFIDCGEFLIKQRYTNKDELFAMGGSAGGLLIGAVINMRPDLFKGVIAAVPFVDVMTTMLDDSIPLTTAEYDEWGNPNEKEYYDYMLSYSPYDNVEAKDYPAMLVITGLHDSQVQYFEPAKWVAKLRALKTDKNLLIMDTDMEAGHGGTTGRFKRYRNTALEYAFYLKLLNKIQ